MKKLFPPDGENSIGKDREAHSLQNRDYKQVGIKMVREVTPDEAGLNPSET